MPKGFIIKAAPISRCYGQPGLPLRGFPLSVAISIHYCLKGDWPWYKPGQNHLQSQHVLIWGHHPAGAITQQGVNKVAVYKDETGKARGFKAACPHLVSAPSALL